MTIKALKQGVSRTIKESEIATYQKNGFTIFKDDKELANANDNDLKKENKELAKENKELKKQVADLQTKLNDANAALEAAKPKE